MLIEGPCEETEHLLQARHQGLAPEVDGRVLINDAAGDGPGIPELAGFTAGRIVDVEITDAFADDSVGRIVGFDAAASTAGSAASEAGS